MSRREPGFEKLRGSIARADTCARSVSEWSVGMHVHHCALAGIEICKSLEASTPPPPRSGLSVVGRLVFSIGRIPRGRGKAPEAVVPTQEITPAELVALLDEAERRLEAARKLDRKTWFEHFAFGVLDRDKAIQLIGIHNRHHLRIIADILAPRRRNAGARGG